MDEAAAKRRKISNVISKWSWKSLSSLQTNIRAETGEKDEKPISKRQVAKSLQPFLDCLEKLTVAGTDNVDVHFWTCNLQKMMALVLAESPQYKALWPNDCRHIKLTLYLDERTGGNVLTTSSSKKSCFFFLFVDVTKYQHIPCLWLPLATIPSRDVAVICGGLSAVTTAVLKHLGLQVEHGITLQGSQCTVEIEAYVGDYDSIASVFMSKGAAGLRPCLLCSNVVSKWSDMPNRDPFFLDISSDKVQQFQIITSWELRGIYDDFLTRSLHATKAARKEQETQFGFSLHSKSLLADLQARSMLPVEKVIYDSCHMYFSNGIVAAEVNLLVKQMNQQPGTMLSDLQRSVREVRWNCSQDSFTSPGSRAFLFHDSLFEGNFYKGGASKTWCLLPLLHYYAFVLTSTELEQSMKCFSALLQAGKDLTMF